MIHGVGSLLALASFLQSRVEGPLIVGVINSWSDGISKMHGDSSRLDDRCCISSAPYCSGVLKVISVYVSVCMTGLFYSLCLIGRQVVLCQSCGVMIGYLVI